MCYINKVYLYLQCNLSVIDHKIKIIKGLMTSVSILISMHPYLKCLILLEIVRKTWAVVLGFWEGANVPGHVPQMASQ